MPDHIRLDYESRSRTDLPTAGLARYVRDPTTQVLMASWEENDSGKIDFWDIRQGRRPPKPLIDAIRDPKVIKWAFNAQFERNMTEHVLGIKTPYSSWRCTMVLAYMLGFSGDLAMIGRLVGLPEEMLKSKEGSKLISRFSKPRKPTKADPREWHDWTTHPEEFDSFGGYNRQDVRAESAIGRRLGNTEKYPILESEWDLYALDQYINDTGVTVNAEFARMALEVAERRKPILFEEMRDITGLSNPNSVSQLLPWLGERGYHFSDMQSETVKQALREADELGLPEEVRRVLKLRQNVSKSSLGKYNTMLSTMTEEDNKYRYSLQMWGASRTGRWAGRGVQLHNLPRTPKMLEDEYMQDVAIEMVKKGDMEGLELLVGEPMDALVGLIRSAFIPTPGYRFVVSDLASIESVVIGWLTDCKWFMDTLHAGRDLYRAFAAEWLKIPYEETKPHRSKAKPATLGAGYGLGGGKFDPIKKKKNGLWAYGEGMGVFMTQQEAHASVNAFRELCPEIVSYWRQLEDAAKTCIKERRSVKCGKVTFEFRKPFMAIVLPSGRRLYYFKPFLKKKTVEYTDKHTGEIKTFESQEILYYGKDGPKWGLQHTYGGKLVENIVQAIARDVLAGGLKRAHEDGFGIPFHVHDEIITEVPVDDEERNLDRLRQHMTAPIPWAPGLPLGAAGWEGFHYRKD
ncbi:DNA polymerase I family A [Cronobacter phage JC01]|uniref:DNA polymerase I family A n=1 Tax=Cronobacter phage JC01 TaxID=2729575 RepID=A0A6M3YKF8_9CAUD|nr:DNA polymerase [Cronobacter phage JC01]QJI52226.1 DNA polymerase I family A [Cronobacter phage JC01]